MSVAPKQWRGPWFMPGPPEDDDRRALPYQGAEGIRHQVGDAHPGQRSKSKRREHRRRHQGRRR